MLPIRKSLCYYLPRIPTRGANSKLIFLKRRHKMNIKAVDAGLVEEMTDVAVTVVSGMIFLSIPVMALISSL